jgi:dTMP kinase
MKRIEFSGCDGSGKTTAFTNACTYLRNKGLRVLATREVGTELIPACVTLRKVAFDPKSGLDGKSMELICAAMRVENEKYYGSVKDQYDVIMSDRGYLDHLAYGDANCGEEFTKSLFVDCISKYTSKPDMILYFDVNIEEARRRRVERNQAVDAIEAKGEEFQLKVAERFRHHIVGEPIVCVVDANKPQEDVFNQVSFFLDSFFR